MELLYINEKMNEWKFKMKWKWILGQYKTTDKRLYFIKKSLLDLRKILTQNKSYLNADRIWKLVLKLWMFKQEFAMEAINPNWTFFSAVVLDSVIRSLIHLLT